MQIAHHRDAEMSVDALQRIHHDSGVVRVERGDRFVGEDDVGLLDQRARDRDALLLPAREMIGALCGELGRYRIARARQGAIALSSVGPPAAAPSATAAPLPGGPISTLVRTSRRPIRLNCWNTMRPRAPPLPQRPPAQRRHVDAVEDDPARARLDQPVDQSAAASICRRPSGRSRRRNSPLSICNDTPETAAFAFRNCETDRRSPASKDLLQWRVEAARIGRR